MDKKMNKGFEILRPRARIIRTLGDELISSETVAIIELVKNSYDALAKEATVRFIGPLEKGKGRIEVIDNGNGMSFETIKTAWMEPATVFKAGKKRITGKKRRILGEKGVGRFAASKLSEKLIMITRPRGSDDEFVVTFNWGDFKHDLYLDQVKCSWERRKAQAIKQHGTTLVMEGLNTDWVTKKNKKGKDAEDIDKLLQLRSALSRLISPFKSDKGFSIFLDLPAEYKTLSGKVEAPPSLSHPHYSIKGQIQEDGSYSLVYESAEKNKENIKDKFILSGDRQPSCGPFQIELRVWDRESERLEQLASKLKHSLKDVRNDLNAAAGISIYRDDFRVMPYGQRDNDWLRLDFRRVQNPTMRLSNNQIVGYVLISLNDNPELKDQSNREGIIESAALNDLKELIRETITHLEIRRYKERPRKEEKDEHGGLLEINTEQIKKFVEERYPNDTELLKLTRQTTEEVSRKVTKVREVLARYRRLATLGQLVDVILHDGHAALNKIDSEILLLERELNSEDIIKSRVNRNLGFIKGQAKVLSGVFNRIMPLSGRKRGEPRRFKLDDVIKNVFDILESELKKYKINVKLPQSDVFLTMDESEFHQIMINLLTNSIYWLSKEPESKRQIVLEIEEDSNYINIIFSDSGPGVTPGNEKHIFEPYFTTKPEGVGLGLTIAGEIAEENKGTLELLKEGELKGACFRISFLKSEGV
ncbi:MAG TPA: ATP-binding protein [Candidatus Omnitrophota bacterium]|nr:ATP-binding protein [Candidatus Omnitrophota bacterium]